MYCSKSKAIYKNVSEYDQETPLSQNTDQPSARERSCSVVECLNRNRGVAGSRHTGITALCPLARHISPSLNTGSIQEDLSRHTEKPE